MNTNSTTLTMVSVYYRGHNYMKLMEGIRFTDEHGKTRVLVDRDAYDKWVSSIVPKGCTYCPGGHGY